MYHSKKGVDRKEKIPPHLEKSAEAMKQLRGEGGRGEGEKREVEGGSRVQQKTEDEHTKRKERVDG